MSIDTALTALAIVLSVVSVALSGWFSIRTARLSHKLADERAEREEAQSALKAAERVYEPLAQSAAELQSRIFNIVESGWVPLMKRYESHGDYAVVSTAFLFAHYFGWIEARRQAVLSSSGEGGRDLSVQKLIDGVLKTLRRSEDSEGFLFFTTEQRAIGELMLEWETISKQRIPKVMGYAAFAERFRADEAFRQWFTPVNAGMNLVSNGDVRRLVDIQRALVALIEELDPKRKYTAGYTLEEIDLTQ
jgi:hypothetical protein